MIAHEYGHHLGLPDYYSTAYSAYNDWNLMATDYSQHMTIFSKQELGWVVPQFLQPGETRNVSDWEEIKNDTGSDHSGRRRVASRTRCRRRTATRTSTTARRTR